MMLLILNVESCAKAGRCHHHFHFTTVHVRGNLALRPSSTKRRTRCTVDFPLSQSRPRPVFPVFSPHVLCHSDLPKQASPFAVSPPFHHPQPLPACLSISLPGAPCSGLVYMNIMIMTSPAFGFGWMNISQLQRQGGGRSRFRLAAAHL